MANEKRLIDANDFIKHFWQRVHDGEIVTLMDAEHAIINAPTVDAVEVVHGRWIQILDNPLVNKFSCSVCGGISLRGNYCLNCGAKMDGGKQ